MYKKINIIKIAWKECICFWLFISGSLLRSLYLHSLLQGVCLEKLSKHLALRLESIEGEQNLTTKDQLILVSGHQSQSL